MILEGRERLNKTLRDTNPKKTKKQKKMTTFELKTDETPFNIYQLEKFKFCHRQERVGIYKLVGT